MSTLNFIWNNIIPRPICGYRADYRRVGEQVAYSHLQTSGSTSGTTVISVHISAPANYEGAIYADCCSGSTSEGDPFAVNAYSPVSITIASVYNGSAFEYRATITSSFPNPYDVYISGTFDTGGVSSTYSALYAAGTTSTIVIPTASIPASSSIVTNLMVLAIAPVFVNGGTLQQFDPVSTPYYFQFYSGTIPETSGSPIAQPSFILDSFVVTEVDSSNNPIAGNLLVKWGQQSVFAGGITPYDNLTFNIKDSNNTIIGELLVDATIKGLREISIPVVKALIPLDTSHQFSMLVYWDNGALVGAARAFYLPDF